MTKLSIVIPIYNPEDKIITSLHRFILNNNNKNIEFIVVNDGSEISYKKKIDELTINSSVKVVIQANGGPGLARNKGIDNAIGEYIWFMDDDDDASDDFVDNILLAINDKPDLIITNFMVSESGKLNGQEFDKLKFKDSLEGYENILLTDHNSKFGNGFLWNKIYKRSLINLFLIKFSTVRFKEDLLFNLQYCKYVKSIIYQKDIFYIYNIHDNGNSYSKYRKERLDNVFYVNESILKMIKKSKIFKIKEVCNNTCLEDLFYALYLSWKYSDDFKLDFKLACDYFKDKKLEYTFGSVFILGFLIKTKFLLGAHLFYKMYDRRS